MKPSHLKFPFSSLKREIIVQDHVWYIPEKNCPDYSFPFSGWNTPPYFDNDHPVCIEYCAGNGTWIANKALTNPHLNWVAVERKFSRVQKIWSKIQNLSLNNLFVVCGEGFQFTQRFLKPATIHEVYVNFPDPWPKRRHARHRIIQAPFVEEIRRILQPNGRFILTTDDAVYSSQMIDCLRNNRGFESEFPSPYFTTEWMDYGTSFFEDLWREKGKTIHYHAFKKMS